MRFTLRNITRNKDFELELPISPVELHDQLDEQSEYIIIDSELPNVSQYIRIEIINQFLLDCETKYSTDEETLKLLCTALGFGEAINVIKTQYYILIDFSEETSEWNYGSGGDIHNADERGRLLHQHGIQFDWEKKYPIAEEMLDDIQWENLWNMAESLGWEAIKYKNKFYLLGGQI